MSFSVEWYTPDGKSGQTTKFGNRSIKDVVQEVFLEREEIVGRTHWAQIWTGAPGTATDLISHGGFDNHCQSGYTYIIAFSNVPVADAMILMPPQRPTPASIQLPVRTRTASVPASNTCRILVQGNFFDDFEETFLIDPRKPPHPVKRKVTQIYNEKLDKQRDEEYQVFAEVKKDDRILDLSTNPNLEAGVMYCFDYDQELHFQQVPSHGMLLNRTIQRPSTEIEITARININSPTGSSSIELQLKLKPLYTVNSMVNLCHHLLKKELASVGSPLYVCVTDENSNEFLYAENPVVAQGTYQVTFAHAVMKNFLSNNAFAFVPTSVNSASNFGSTSSQSEPNPIVRNGSSQQRINPKATIVIPVKMKIVASGHLKTYDLGINLKPPYTVENLVSLCVYLLKKRRAPIYDIHYACVTDVASESTLEQRESVSANNTYEIVFVPPHMALLKIPNLNNLTIQEPENTVDFDTENLIQVERPPFPTIPLSIPCPNAGCAKDKKTWNCIECEEPLVYGFDDFVYCKCGRLALEALRFKCANHKRHVPYRHIADEMHQIPLKKYNILVLGASGVGKSTWINGLVNYITYSSFKDADEGVLHILIPAKVFGQGNKEVTLGNEEDSNEQLTSGDSHTQKPKAYTFMFEGNQFSIIDVPGFGDSRGMVVDRRNLQMVMQELQYYEEIHAICYLSKSNGTRLTTEAQYILGSLTTQLHKESVRNLLFCFTYSDRGTDSAGDNRRILQNYFNDFNSDNGISINLCRDNMFYFENQAIEYLGCKKANENPAFDERKAVQAFTLSQEHTKRLLRRVTELPSHNTRMMLSINEARRIINTLTPILAKVTESIKTNEHMLQRQEEELSNIQETEVETRKHLMMKQVALNAVKIDYPRTVCQGEGCFKTIPIPNSDHSQIFNEQVCHGHCYLSDVPENTTNHPGLRSCAAMKGEYCRYCNHHYSTHLHIKCIQELVVKEVENPAAKRRLEQSFSEKIAVADLISGLREEQDSHKQEEQVIRKICVKFCWFLTEKSLRDTNDAYMDMLVQAMEIERVCNYRNGNKYAELEQSLNMYQEEKRLFAELQNGVDGEQLSEYDIDALKQELIALRINGSAIKQNLDIIEEQDRQYKRENVTVFNP
ncbi:hypothetical protein QR680_011215 [Steinernema hermaphroditum]|uniref:DUF8206 domain-containing protein n=1 Tax=Steinernema hermaphroditum TaxID=289476 RepID=A0AA39ISP6_9BILA|nr:hypothetical protein QR680_011215 [Steinernema hermaphroditum]